MECNLSKRDVPSQGRNDLPRNETSLELEPIFDKTKEEWIQYYPLLTINDARFLDEELLLFSKVNWNFPMEFLDSIREEDFLPMDR